MVETEAESAPEVVKPKSSLKVKKNNMKNLSKTPMVPKKSISDNVEFGMLEPVNQKPYVIGVRMLEN